MEVIPEHMMGTTLDIYVLLLGWYLCWWTISLSRYYPPSSFCIDIIYIVIFDIYSS
jgi:hypothetical protein